MSPPCITRSLTSPLQASVFRFATEQIHAFLFSSTECQTCSKHKEDSEPHPRPWGASSLVPLQPERQENWKRSCPAR